jgi:hypothetical protein
MKCIFRRNGARTFILLQSAMAELSVKLLMKNISSQVEENLTEDHQYFAKVAKT